MSEREEKARLKVLVFNCGSSSIKYRLYQMPGRTAIAKGMLQRIGESGASLVHEYRANGGTEPVAKHELAKPIADHEQGVELILSMLADPEIGALENIQEIGAVGHRVVHGGDEFTGSMVIDDAVLATLERFSDLAPLHNPPNLTGIRAAQAKLPGIPQVACFDTAFHQTIPEVAYLYALPYELYEKYRIRRYGFHGTSHRFVARRAAKMLGRGKYDVNVITCHLGNGCSMTAVKHGKSVDTSMGMTPLEGAVMGTRTGDFDAAILFYLGDKGYSLDDLNSLCNKQSGLLGLSGKSNDMRNLAELAEKGNRRAQLAIDIFCYRIKKYIGAYTAVLGSLDAVVFTGGIGENAPDVRAAICENLGHIGITIDPKKNAAARGREADVGTDDGSARVLVIPTDEEGAIAGDTYELAMKHIGENGGN